MNVLSLVNKLRRSGINIYIDGSDLKLGYTTETVDPLLLSEIKAHKNELMDLLNSLKEKDGPVTSGHVPEKYPVPYQQKAIWLLSQDETFSIAYNMPVIVQINEEVN